MMAEKRKSPPPDVRVRINWRKSGKKKVNKNKVENKIKMMKKFEIKLSIPFDRDHDSSPTKKLSTGIIC